MNRIILMGRLTKDPEIYYSQGDAPTAIARFSIAVDKKQKREDGITADFFQMVSFGKAAEFAEKYLHKGMKMLFAGRVQTGRYEKDDVTMMDWFKAKRLDVIVVANKADKCKKSELPGNVALVRETLDISEDTPLLYYSAQTHTEREALRVALDWALDL